MEQTSVVRLTRIRMRRARNAETPQRFLVGKKAPSLAKSGTFWRTQSLNWSAAFTALLKSRQVSSRPKWIAPDL